VLVFKAAAAQSGLGALMDEICSLAPITESVSIVHPVLLAASLRSASLIF
jgi:hypothetical protein